MPPAPHEYHGRAAIAAFLRASLDYRGSSRVTALPARANTQPAFGTYIDNGTLGVAVPAGLIVLTATAGGISAITRFHNDALYSRFGLPDVLSIRSVDRGGDTAS